MSTANDIYKQLAAEFPAEMIKQVTKSGTRLDYVPVSEVIARMNRVIGVGNWSSQIISVGRDALEPDHVTAQVRLTAVIDGQTVHRVAVGQFASAAEARAYAAGTLAKSGLKGWPAKL